jgi:hypothetical protein
MSARRGLAVAALFFAGLAAEDAHALGAAAAGASATAAASPSPLTLTATPVFGTDAAGGGGWTEVVARVSNTGGAPIAGTVELTSSWAGHFSGAPDTFVARAPFVVGAHVQAVLRIPVRSVGYVSSATVAALADGGTKLAETTVSLDAEAAPLLVDVETPSRVSVVMRGWPMTPAWHPAYAAMGPTTTLTVGSPESDPTTGDPVLPERAAGYAAATVVLIPSDRLARLDGAQRDALVGWVLAGGTLAVIPTRPEDLRTGVLTTLAGGPITPAAMPPVMLTLPGAVRPGGASSPFSSPPPAWESPPPATPSPTIAPSPTPLLPDRDAGAGAGSTPIGYFVPVRATPFGGAGPIGPSPALRARLTGFAGGHLVPSEYGATAAYGLGQVHVLGFHPGTEPAIDDPWAHARLLDMLADAWDRRAVLAFPHGGGPQRAGDLSDVHGALDPNEGFRPALGVAALLLVLYSIASGPLLFRRARLRGRPLEPLVWAPVLSAGCFALIVVVGLAGKGWGGRARRLALVEAGAGTSRGTVRRFRAFYSSRTRSMRVRASEPDAVLDVVSSDSRDADPAVLRIDQQGASLEDLTGLPWQTVVVGEDGFTDLGSGVAVQGNGDGSVVVTNRTGRALRDVIVWAPDTEATWFARIDDGATVVSSGGRALFTRAARSSATAGTRVVHELDTSRWASALGGRAADEMVPWWSAVSSAAGPAVDWFPDDVPVVMGEIAGGEGARTDSGLRVDSDHLLFRVVGDGGRS